MNGREDYAKEAMQDGRAAARSGKGSNPHPIGTSGARAWDQGWDSIDIFPKKDKKDDPKTL